MHSRDTRTVSCIPNRMSFAGRVPGRTEWVPVIAVSSIAGQHSVAANVTNPSPVPQNTDFAAVIVTVQEYSAAGAVATVIVTAQEYSAAGAVAAVRAAEDAEMYFAECLANIDDIGPGKSFVHQISIHDERMIQMQRVKMDSCFRKTKLKDAKTRQQPSLVWA